MPTRTMDWLRLPFIGRSCRRWDWRRSICWGISLWSIWGLFTSVRMIIIRRYGFVYGRKCRMRLVTWCWVSWPCSRVFTSSLRVLMKPWRWIMSSARGTCCSPVDQPSSKPFSVPTCSTYQHWPSKCARKTKTSSTQKSASWSSALSSKAFT